MGRVKPWPKARGQLLKNATAFKSGLVHRFYIALCSALEQTRCSFVTLNKQLSLLQCALNIHPSGVVAVLFGLTCDDRCTWIP